MAAENTTGEQRLIVIGAIGGAHGVRGDVRVRSYTGEPEAVFDYGPLLDEKGAVILEALSARPAKDFFIVRPKSPRQKEEWDALKGVKLHVPREAFDATEENEFYIEDLVGLTARSPEGETLGRVKSVQDFGAGDLLEITPAAGGKSVFVPFTVEAAPRVDIIQNTIIIEQFKEWADESEGRDT